VAAELQVVLAVGACLGLAQAPMTMHDPSTSHSGHCGEKAPGQPTPEKAMAGCHACTLPKPDDEDEAD